METRTAAPLTDRGFTLIEFLVAIVILMVGLLGLLQTVNVALDQNLKNQLRNEGVIVADEQMAKELSKGFDLVSTSTRSYVISNRQVLSAFRNFSVARSGAILQNSKQVNFTVSWRHKGVSYNHGASAMITKTNQ